MDDPIFDKKYQKYKLKVKLWEKSFKTKYGRIPSKHDIRDASMDIKYAYKMYYKLKTSLLEDTLCDVLGDELEDGFELTQSDSNFSLSDLNSSSQIPSLIAARVSFCDPKPIKEFEAEEILTVNENAWGKHLNVEKENVKITPKIDTPPTHFKTSLKPQLFESKNFAKRNPRKSFSRLSSVNLSSSSCNTFDSQREVLPDLETILNERSLERNKSTQHLVKSSSIQLEKPHMKLANLNEKWLDRCDSMINLKSDMNYVDCSTTATSINNCTSFGISGLNLTSITGNVNPTSSMHSSNRSSLLSSASSAGAENVYDTSLCASDPEVIQNSDNEAEELSIFHIRKRRKLMSSQQNLRSLNILDTIDKVPMEGPKEENPAIFKEVTSKTAKKVSKIVKKKVIKPVKNIAPVARAIRARRTVTKKVKNYTETDKDDMKEYAFDVSDDSDADADYTVEADTNDVNYDDDKSLKKKSPKTRVTKAKNARSRTKEANLSEINTENAQTYSEYFPEFDIEHIRNVPQIDINELNKSSKIFEKYLVTSNSAIDTASSGKSSINTLSNTREQHIAGKIKAGKLNENFVRIDIRRKKFVRGKKTFNYSKWKKTQWSKKKVAALSGPDMNMGGCDGGVLICFQCGGVGHYAQNCKVKGDDLLPLEAENEAVSPFPTLEDAEEMAKLDVIKAHGNNPAKLPEVDNPLWKEPLEVANIADENITNSQIKFIGHRIPDDIIQKSGILDVEKFEERFKVNPLYKTNPDGSLIDTPQDVLETLKLFGHKNFRAGQEKAIMRILSGVSTLVTLSTGSGKSLCYQLPAFLYAKKMKCCTLVISPLVSLMEDQVHGVPSFLNAQCLHTNQSPAVKEKISQMISAGNLDVLLISPEAVLSAENMSGFGSILKQLPPIAFVCIDEVHCVSQWSHNFRPSYLMICRVLREKLRVKTILGLTATATCQTRLNIVEHIGIPDGVTGIISDIPLPDNLTLSVSCDENRDQALIELLRSERFEKCKSIIIYCIRRNECERIATYIRTYFQNSKPSQSAAPTSVSRKRKISDWIAEPYHAGLAPSRRKAIQNKFMRGNLKIVVATIAFGMGINKPDIRAVIHYNMPKSFESYVQEVGRAGRDGLPAQCHLFLDSKGNDQNELRRHIYANSIDRHVIRKLLQKVFVPCACSKDKDIVEKPTKFFERDCPGHEISFSVEKTIEFLDIPEENISTILCYMELHENRYIQTMRKAYTMCKIVSYGGPRALRQAAQGCAPLAMAIALDIKKGITHDTSNVIEFAVIEVAAAIGWDSGVVKHQLKNLEWTNKDGYPKRSNISVSFFDLGFRVKAPGDLTDTELDETLDLLHKRVSHQEKSEIIQLQIIFDAFQSITFPSYRNVIEIEKIVDRSNKLKTIIRDYFQSELDVNVEIEAVSDNTPDGLLKGDIRTMIQQYPENNFTGRTLARIFHGCPSPNFPAVIWGRSKFWRAHLKVDFNRIVALANSEIIVLRQGSARY